MSELDALRDQIDGIDRELVELFCRRMAVTRAVGEYKQAHGIPVLDVARERQVLGWYLGGYRREELPEKTGLTQKAVDNALYRARKKLQGLHE